MGVISAAKGVTQIDNSSTMAGPAQMMKLADELARVIDESVPAVANLPAAGAVLNGATNWVGRTVTVDANGMSYRWNGTAWFAVNGSCRVRTSTPQATHATPQQTTAVTWNIADLNTGGFFSGSGSRLTAPVTGLYELRGKLRYGSTSFAGGVVLGKNGVKQLDTEMVAAHTAVGSYAETTSTFQLAAGDYLEVYSIGLAASLSLSIDRCFAEMRRVG